MSNVAEKPAATLPAHTRCTRLLRWLRNGAICYLGIIFVLLLLENKLIFHPVKASEDWIAPPNSLVQDIELRLPEGTRLHAWWCPTPGWQPDQGAMLYCHGNAGNLSYRAGSINHLQRELNVAVLIFDYPGYGKSDGKPSEASCYAAADAGYDWLMQVRHVPGKRIILYGGSLGGAVAVDLASRRPHRALVLVRTFTSMPDEAQLLYPWLPARWLVRTQFNSLAKIKHCRQPVFIAHGTADQLIPYVLGEQLFAAANEPKQFCAMAGVDHNDGMTAQFYVCLRSFLSAE